MARVLAVTETESYCSLVNNSGYSVDAPTGR